MRVREVRLPLLLLLEIFWGWAFAAVFAQALSGGRAPGPSVIGAAAVVLGSTGLSSALRQFDIEERTMRIIGVSATVFGLALILPLEYSAALSEIGPQRSAMSGAGVAFVVLWVRGILRGRGGDEFEGALRTVALGLLPIAVAAGTLPDAHGPQAFGALALLYGMLGLLVLALYRTAEPQRPVRTLASQWGMATIVVAAIAGALLLLAFAIDPGSSSVLAPLGEPLRPVGRMLVQYVLGPPLSAIGWLISHVLPDFTREVQVEPQEFEEEQRRDPDDDGPAWSLPVRYLLGGLIATGVVLAVLLLLALLFRRNRRPQEDEELPATEREGAFADDLSDLFGMLGNRFRRRRDRQSAVAIHRLYVEMLDHASEHGIDRPPATTPLQFAPVLDARYRSGLPTDITLAFADSRYGAREIDRTRVDDLRRRWDELGGR